MPSGGLAAQLLAVERRADRRAARRPRLQLQVLRRDGAGKDLASHRRRSGSAPRVPSRYTAEPAQCPCVCWAAVGRRVASAL